MKFNKTKYPIRTIINWLWQHHKGCRRQAVMNMGIGLVQVTAGLFGVEVLRQLTDIATQKTEGPLIITAAVYVGIILLEFLCNISHTWLAAVLGAKSQNDMQRSFFHQLLKGQWAGIERYHSGDVLNRLFSDVTDIVNLMTEVLPFLVTLTVQFVASLVYLLIMDAKLAYILVIACPIFLLLSKLYFRRMRRIVRKVKDSNSALQSIIQESIQHKLVIKVMEMADEMVSRLEKHQLLLQWQIKARARFSILTRTIIFIGFRGSALIALIYCLIQLNNQVITVGVLMAFTQLVSRIQHPLLELGRLFPTFVNSLTSSERLMELEELPLENECAGQTAELPKSAGIRFSNVTYQYTAEGRKVLANFTHEFLPGTFTAVLGETGVGKTTMLRLMLHLIEPQEGTITPITESPVTSSWRSLFSYVPQGNSLFSGTIRENLRFGKPDATSEEMYAALHLAEADFVKTLPHGLDTPCGEGGGGLSEGQAQRIAIARAIIRPCRILLLDEATSALDITTEQTVLQNIKSHFADTTIIFVTHRLSAVSFATEQLHFSRNE